MIAAGYRWVDLSPSRAMSRWAGCDGTAQELASILRPHLDIEGEDALDEYLREMYDARSTLGSRTHRCPACGAESWYVPDADRYVHTDGSEVRPCWRRCTRGDTPYSVD